MSAFDRRFIVVHVYPEGIDVDGNVSGRCWPQRRGDHGGCADPLRVREIIVGQEQRLRGECNCGRSAVG